MYTNKMSTRKQQVVIIFGIFLLSIYQVVFGEPEGQCHDTSVTGIITQEKRLISCLLDTYDKRVRPAPNASAAVTVEMHMVMSKIIALEEKTQTLVTDGWMHMAWSDPQLRWKPADYGGIEQIRVPVDELWTPDIVLFNNAHDDHSFEYDRLVEVNHTGRIHWVPHTHLYSYCGLEMSHFPYDTQTCYLYFGSWTYDRRFLDVQTNNEIKVQFLFDTAEFEILSFERHRKEMKFLGTETFPYIEYKLIMKRNSAFHRNMFVAPAVILAILNMFQFFVPPNSAQRITLGTGILLANTLLFMMLEQYMPTSTTTFPVIGVYYLFNMIMTALAIIISLLVMNFNQPGHSKRTVPDWTRKIFLHTCAKFLCIKQDGYRTIPSGDLQTTSETVTDEFSVNYDDNNANELSSDVFRRSPTTALEKTLDEIRKYLRQLSMKDSGGEDIGPSHEQLVKAEWLRLAAVVDRLFFWSYCLTTVLMTLVLIGYE